ncbi:MAG: hypothetical protein DMG21_11280 [Acidobacteria bacterium]|nr:MAG: hypothetical protein DMG21_11280 [Acidobacteriota bacterium]
MKRLLAVLVAVCALPLFSAAQEPAPATPPAETSQTPENPPPPENQGFLAFVVLGSSATGLGTVASATGDFGFNFTPHIIGEGGLPIIFTRNPFSQVTTKDWRYVTLMADPYVDVRYHTEKFGLRVTSILTGTIPVSNSVRIWSTGRVEGDWFNHLERDFGKVQGFLNFGAASGTINRAIFPRPYSMDRPYHTLGAIGDIEGGAQHTFFKRYTIGGSVYGLLPVGSQKVFSRLVAPDFPLGSDGNHNRVFDAEGGFETKGPSKIARDNGYSGWVEVGRLSKYATLQFSYTQSVHYHLGTATAMLKVDLSSLFRSPPPESSSSP